MTLHRRMRVHPIEGRGSFQEVSIDCRSSTRPQQTGSPQKASLRPLRANSAARGRVEGACTPDLRIRGFCVGELCR